MYWTGFTSTSNVVDVIFGQSKFVFQGLLKSKSIMLSKITKQLSIWITVYYKQTWYFRNWKQLLVNVVCINVRLERIKMRKRAYLSTQKMTKNRLKTFKEKRAEQYTKQIRKREYGTNYSFIEKIENRKR